MFSEANGELVAIREATHQSITLKTPSPQLYRRPKVVAQEDSSVPWTASRCHRLLRPLLSHIASLRREVARDALQTRSKPVEPSPKRPREEEPAMPRKKVRYTYSMKRSRQRDGSQSRIVQEKRHPFKSRTTPKLLQPGDVVIPSPVLRRGQHPRGKTEPIPTEKAGCARKPRVRSACLSLDCPPPRSATEDELGRLRTKIGAGRFGLYESIFRAFGMLLRATEVQVRAAAPKSLLGMCLRKVPKYISELEYWEEKDSEENGTRSAIQGSKVAFEVYEELEGFGVGEGWVHLRTILRAHAAHLLRDAVTEGLFEAPFPTLLVKLCARFKAHAEAEDILDALVNYQSSVDASSEVDFPLANSIQAMMRYGHETGRTAFLLIQLSAFLARGQLDEAWIFSDDFGSVWSSATRALPETGSCDAAISFIGSSITALCSSRRSSLASFHPKKSHMTEHSSQYKLISILASLGATMILANDAISQAPDSLTAARARTTAGRVALIIETCLAATKNSRKEDIKMRRYLLHLTTFLSTINTADSAYVKTTSAAVNKVWEDVWKGRPDDARPRQLYNDTMALVASMAHYYGRGSSEQPRRHLTELCDHMARVELPVDLFRRKERDAAFLLAERTNDLRDLAFAETFQPSQTPCRKRAAGGSTGRSGMTGQYRWEAGISEWITISPVVAKVKHTTKLAANPAAGNRRMTRSKNDQAGGGVAPPPKTKGGGEAGPQGPVLARNTKRLSVGSTVSRKKRSGGFGSLLDLLPGDDDDLGQENLGAVVPFEARRAKLSRNSASSPENPPPLKRVSNSRIRFLDYQSDDELGL